MRTIKVEIELCTPNSIGKSQVCSFFNNIEERLNDYLQSDFSEEDEDGISCTILNVYEN